MEFKLSDVIAEMGAAFLGSRLKRLGERMQAGAAAMISHAGLPLQPAQMPVLAALRQKPLTIGQLSETVGARQPGVTRTVGQLAELGMVETLSSRDQRERRVALTRQGEAAVATAAIAVWPRIGQAAQELYAGIEGSLLDQIAAVEAALAEASITERAMRLTPNVLRIVEFRDELAREFHDINAEWITAMFALEHTDREVLENPGARIIEPGGAILFVEADGLGIVGTCALQKTGPSAYELTKMGVRESARGLKAGEFLLRETIERARQLGADPLYLLTNKRCEAAIHLYEKLGFAHDEAIMARYAARYERCDVAMRYAGPLEQG